MVQQHRTADQSGVFWTTQWPGKLEEELDYDLSSFVLKVISDCGMSVDEFSYDLYPKERLNQHVMQVAVHPFQFRVRLVLGHSMVYQHRSVQMKENRT